MRHTKWSSAVLLLLLWSACKLFHPDDSEIKSRPMTIVNAFPNLGFSSPVFFSHSNDGTNRVFVVERSGTIRAFENDSAVSSVGTFLDIRNRIAAGGEMGLLGLAFHPNYDSNGLFYVNYTAGSGSGRRTVVSQFSSQGAAGDPGSESILLEFNQPFSNHNGGMLAFGQDGYLYIATGDGGSGGDPLNNGQNPSTLLGAILRIDVDNPANGKNYGIPADNPFVAGGGRAEIYAYGLRNPWRFSIDDASGEIWAGDVGQNSYEEVDLITSGGNYGWRIMEGFHCFQPPSGCNQSGLNLPVKEYPNTGFSGDCSVTGGYVYRGDIHPELIGAYIYGDYCSGKIWMLRAQEGQLSADSLLIDSDISIASFGVDENDELHIVDLNAGRIYRFGL